MSFNPNDPCALGMEWRPTAQTAIVMDTVLSPGANQLESSATETVDAISIYSLANNGSAPLDGHMIEVYEDGVFPDPDLTTLTYRPSADAWKPNAYNFAIGAVGWTTDHWNTIAQATQTPSTWPLTGQYVDDDGFIYGVNGVGYGIGVYFGLVDGTVAGKYVTRVTLVAKVQSYIISERAVELSAMTFTPFLTIDGVQYTAPSQTFTSQTPSGWEVRHSWDYNPRTKAQWTPADIDKFDDANATAYGGWISRGTNTPHQIAAILQGWMEVEHAGDDAREAYGSISDFPAEGWYSIGLTQPDGTPGWAKVSGTTYRLTFRRVSITHGTGMPIIANVRGGDRSIRANGWTNLELTHSLNPYLPLSAEEATGDLFAPCFLLHVGVGLSADSQPYHDISSELVNSASSVEQEFTTPDPVSTGDYGLVRLLIAQESSTAPAPLVVVVRRRSDDVQIGGALTITADDFAELEPAASRRTSLHDVHGLLSSPAPIVASTQYYVELTSVATPGEGWVVQVADALTAHAAATLNGATDAATVANVERSGSDAELALYTIPVPPTGLAASAVSWIDAAQTVALSWTPTAVADCGSFSTYEVQRADSSSGPWYDIATVNGESTSTFEDREARLNVANYYRMRVSRADGAASEWTPTVSATPAGVDCGYVFSSNHDDTIEVYAPDVSDGVRVTQLPQNVVERQFYGRDGTVLFHELEDRLSRFKRTLVVAAVGATDSTPAPTTYRDTEFDAILYATRPSRGSSIPYICVRDDLGNRWFASVYTPETQVRRAAGWFTIEVEVVEATLTPAAVVVEAEGS